MSPLPPSALLVSWNRADYSPMWGYVQSVSGTKVSLIDRGLTQRSRLNMEPALSFVPDALDPPKGCCPTTDPVGLSFT